MLNKVALLAAWLALAGMLDASAAPAPKPVVVMQNVAKGKLGLVALSSDTRLMASVDVATLKLWDMSSGLMIRDYALSPECGYVRMSFLDQDRKLAVGCVVFKGRHSKDFILDLESGRWTSFSAETFIQDSEGGEIGKVGAYSPNGETLAQLSKRKVKKGPDPELRIYRVRDGKLLHRLPFTPSLYQTSDNQRFIDDNTIAHCAPEKKGQVTLVLHDVNTGGQISAPDSTCKADLRSISPDRRQFIYQAWDAEGRRSRLFSQSRSGEPRDIALPAAVSPGTVESVRFAADGKTIRISAFHFDSLVSSWVTVDAATLAVLDSTISPRLGMAPLKIYDRDNFLTRLNDGRWLLRQETDVAPELWDTARSTLIRRLGITIDMPVAHRWSRDGRYLATITNLVSKRQVLQVWDLASARIVRALAPTDYQLEDFQFDPETNQLLLSTKKAYKAQPGLIRLDINSGKSTTLLPNQVFTTFSMSPDGKWLIDRTSADFKSNLTIRDYKTGQPVFRHSVAGANYRVEYDLRFSADAQTIFLYDSSGNPFFVKVGEWQARPMEMEHAYVATGAAIHPDFSYYATSVTRELSFFKTGKNKPFIKLPERWAVNDLPVYSPDGSLMLFHDAQGVLTLYSARIDNNKLKPIRPLIAQGEPGSARHDWSPDGRFLLGYGDGGLILRNGKTGELVATLTGLDQSDSMAILPTGEYLATKGAMKSVGFSIGLAAYTFEQFDLRFNRPDMVLKAIGMAPQRLVDAAARAREKRLARAGFSEASLATDFQLPEVKVSRDGLPAATLADKVRLEVRARDPRVPLDRLLVTVNDVPFDGRVGGIDLKGERGLEIRRSVDVPILPGSNRIQVAVLNAQGVESYRETIEIRGDMAPVPGKVYALAIGVSQYRDKGYNLRYAAKDAQDIGSAFKAAPRTSGSSVTTVLDAQATRAEILKAKETLMAASPNDAVIVFLAGHGLLDDKLDYYFATHDIDFQQPARRGLAYDDIEGLLDGIAARRKVLLMDTCHSGELDKGDVETTTLAQAEPGKAVQMRAIGQRGLKQKSSLGQSDLAAYLSDLFADTRRGPGAVVISSAGGAEFALESDEWKNGVFTFSLLEGLKTRSADRNKDGVVSISEIRDLVQTRVPALTQGKQTPTTRRDNLVVDFVVY
jgi:Tol biopolymer transport system component